MILAGTTADKMRGVYSRPHRNSLNEPATIYDIPFEVLKESFIFLVKQYGSDLVSASLTCRAFRAVAFELMNSRRIFDEECEGIERVICGLQLRSIVGLEMCTIKHLIVDIGFVGKEYIPLIAHCVAPTLSSLGLCFRDGDTEEDSSTACFEALGFFFEQCDSILALRLEFLDFGDDHSAILQVVKDGFGRLRQHDLFGCRGNIRMFVENTPIPKLRCLAYQSNLNTDNEIVILFASNCRELTRVRLSARFDSSASLLKVVECCRSLESLAYSNLAGELTLERSDILAISSLPRLKSLGLGCMVASDTYSALVRCRGLKAIRIPFLVDPTALLVIGRGLISLCLGRPSKEVVDGIVEHCPNLQYLELRKTEMGDEGKEVLVGSIKNGLKKLAKLKINEDGLGTDWEGI
jgi:hypothetical protein